MNAKEHRIAGICAGVATCLYIDNNIANEIVGKMDIVYQVVTYSVIIGSSSFGSLVPDIDRSNSTFGRKLGPISKGLEKFFGHRGLFHYPLFLALMTFGLYIGYNLISFPIYNVLNFNINLQFIYQIISIGFVTGYLSHIILDMFNGDGIKLLAPFIGFHFKIPTGITFKKKNKIISWRYLSGSSVVDKCIANFISLSSVFLYFLYISGYISFHF